MLGTHISAKNVNRFYAKKDSFILVKTIFFYISPQGPPMKNWNWLHYINNYCHASQTLFDKFNKKLLSNK